MAQIIVGTCGGLTFWLETNAAGTVTRAGASNTTGRVARFVVSAGAFSHTVRVQPGGADVKVPAQIAARITIDAQGEVTFAGIDCIRISVPE